MPKHKNELKLKATQRRAQSNTIAADLDKRYKKPSVSETAEIAMAKSAAMEIWLTRVDPAVDQAADAGLLSTAVIVFHGFGVHNLKSYAIEEELKKIAAGYDLRVTFSRGALNYNMEISWE